MGLVFTIIIMYFPFPPPHGTEVISGVRTTNSVRCYQVKTVGMPGPTAIIDVLIEYSECDQRNLLWFVE